MQTKKSVDWHIWNFWTANLYLAKILLHQQQFAANGYLNPYLS